MTNLLFSITAQTDQPAPSTGNGLSIVGWLVGFLVAGCVVAIVAWPLLNVKSWLRHKQAGPEQLEMDALYNRLETEQLALNELEFDHEAGALTESDYVELKISSQSVIQELEQAIKERNPTFVSDYEFRPEIQPATSPAHETGNVAVATRKANPTTIIENETSHKRITVKKALQCSECKTAFKPGDRFCSHCGAPLPFVCKDCGSELSSDDRFCAKCGATVRR